MRRYITVIETWVHHYSPKTREQSKQWVFKGKRAPKKVKSVGKVMATVFWDACGIIYADYMEKGQKITEAYYASLLDRLSAEKEKRPHLKKILFHQNNTRVQTCAVSVGKIVELKFELLHQLYSPYLTPSDFF